MRYFFLSGNKKKYKKKQKTQYQFSNNQGNLFKRAKLLVLVGFDKYIS